MNEYILYTLAQVAYGSIGFQPVLVAPRDTPDRQDAYAALRTPQSSIGFQPVLVAPRNAPDRQDAYATLLASGYEFPSQWEVTPLRRSRRAR
jgi:hypothetical protein